MAGERHLVSTGNRTFDHRRAPQCRTEPQVEVVRTTPICLSRSRGAAGGASPERTVFPTRVRRGSCRQQRQATWEAGRARPHGSPAESARTAPGGIEPPHTDSKSVALSTELRGPRGVCPSERSPPLLDLRCRRISRVRPIEIGHSLFMERRAECARRQRLQAIAVQVAVGDLPARGLPFCHLNPPI